MASGSLRGWVAAVALAFSMPSAWTQGVVLHSDLVYATVPVVGGTKNLRIDVYEPTLAPTPRPLVLWIHGGGWQAGSENNPGAKFLADSGYVVASVQYRLSQEAVWPAQIHDVKGAVRWLRANAATFGIDVDRFGAWGSSAGGHLTAFLATSADVGIVRLGGTTIDLEGSTGGNTDLSSRIQAAVDWFGPTDFVAMDGFPSTIDHDSVNSPESSLLGADIDTVLMRVASADPRTFVSPDDPPLLIQHGTADPAVPYSQSERLFEIGRHGFGLDFRFVPVPDGGHGGPGFDSQLAKSFFDEHLMSTPATELEVVAIAGANEGGGGMPMFRITRTGAITSARVVFVSTAGTATEGVDYAAVGTAVTIPAGASFLDVAIVPIDDALVEGDETIELRLSATQGALLRSGSERAVATLADDDSAAGLPVVSVLATDEIGIEGAANPARFTFTRSGSSTTSLSVAVKWSGRALSGVDYLPLPSDVVFPAGASSVDRIVTVIDDTRVETAESVVVEIVPGPHYALSAARSADVRIDDNDATGTLPQVTIAVEDDVLAETDALSNAFLLSRTGSTASSLTVSVAISGDASFGADFVPFANQITFVPGEAHHRIRIDPVNDATIEGDEDLLITVLPNAGYRVGLVSQASVRIADDDTPSSEPSLVTLRTGGLRGGATFPLTVIGPAPGQPWVLLAAVEPGFAPVPSGFPVLLDAASMVVIGPFFLDATGVSSFAVALPPAFPDPSAARIFLQAAVATPSSVVLSERVERRVLPAGP